MWEIIILILVTIVWIISFLVAMETDGNSAGVVFIITSFMLLINFFINAEFPKILYENGFIKEARLWLLILQTFGFVGLAGAGVDNAWSRRQRKNEREVANRQHHDLQGLYVSGYKLISIYREEKGKIPPKLVKALEMFETEIKQIHNDNR